MDERVDVNIEGWRQAFGLRFILRGGWFDDFLLTIYSRRVGTQAYIGTADERCWVVFGRGRASFELEFVGGKVASAPI